MTHAQPDLSQMTVAAELDYPWAGWFRESPPPQGQTVSRVPDRESIRDILWEHVSDDIYMIAVVDQLANYFVHGDVNITDFAVTGLRAGCVNVPDSSSDKEWPVVEWRECRDTDVLAIFKVNEQTSQCSWLLHRGEGRWHQHGRWRRSFLTWYLTDIQDLCDLLAVAQQDLGLLHWCEIVGEVAEPSDNVYSSPLLLLRQRLTEYAKYRLSHLLRGRQLRSSFDKVRPIIEQLSEQRGKCTVECN